MSVVTLLVTPDTDFEAQVKRAFDGQIDLARWWDDRLPRLHPEQAVQMMASEQPAVAVLGPGLPTPAALELAEAFDLRHPEVCVVLVAKPTTRLWELALRAGVREIIPLDPEDEMLSEAIARAEATAPRRQASGGAAKQEEARKGRIITVMSPKGGAGKTTVATNLAVKLGEHAPGKVVIVDFDLQFGDVATALALGPQSTIADAARAKGRLDTTALKVFLEPHPAGLYALVGPHFPAEAEEVSAATAGHVLDLLAGEFDFVIVDTAAGLDEFTLTAAERSDDLVLVCVTDVPSVRALRKATDALDLLGMTKQRRHLVLNRADDRVGLSGRDVEATIGLPIDAQIPTSRNIPISVNQGSPVVASDHRSPAARALSDLTRRLSAEPAPVPATNGWFSRKDGR
jgi:pilus assembly protein CpaE